MTNQTDEIQAEVAVALPKKMGWRKADFLFLLLLVSLFIGVLSYGYMQRQILLDLKNQTASAQNQVAGLQQSITGLHEVADQAQQVSQTAATQAANRAAELYSQLMRLDEQIDHLPLLLPQPLEKKIAAQPAFPMAEQAALSGWRGVLVRSWQELQKIVVVRHIGENTIPLVSPEEKLFLYQNLHAQIEAAMWGALHQNAVVYQAGLARASAWIQQYFIQDAPETTTILQSLHDLQKMDITTSAQ